MLKKDRYSYRIIWSEDDEEYVGKCAEFPSLSWLEETPEGALKGIRKVVAEVVEDMKKNGEELPQPLAMKKYSGKFMLRMMPDQHKELAIRAAENQVSLNRFATAKLCSVL